MKRKMCWSFATLVMLCLLEKTKLLHTSWAVFTVPQRSVSIYSQYLLFRFLGLPFLNFCFLYFGTSPWMYGFVWLSSVLCHVVQFLACRTIIRWIYGQLVAVCLSFMLEKCYFQVQLIMTCFVFIWNWKVHFQKRCLERFVLDILCIIPFRNIYVWCYYPG